LTRWASPVPANGSQPVVGRCSAVSPRGGGATMKGKVKWFNVTKRFGFLVRDDNGPDVFVHASDVEAGRTLREGEVVEFEVGQDDRGRPKATQVRVAA
jgi:CspA family cold shock protein